MTAKLYTFALVMVSVATLLLIINLDRLYESSLVNEDQVKEEYEIYKKKYHKNYLTAVENSLRYGVFYDNYKKITIHNLKPNENFKLEINQFADLTDEEYSNLFLGLKSSIYYEESDSQDTLRSSKKRQNLKDNIDWTTKLIPPKDQGTCGSCWTFCTTGAVEALYAIKTNSSPANFAEQYLVDCDITPKSHGCGGGEMVDAYAYYIENGVVLQKDYPYMAMDMKCKTTAPKISWKPTSQGIVPAKDNDALLAQLGNGPIAIALNAASYFFRFYSSGVLDHGCSYGELDHGVLIVGTGVDNGINYWNVRNSWGPNWGLNGHIRLLRVAGQNPGMCGLAMQPTYPIA